MAEKRFTRPTLRAGDVLGVAGAAACAWCLADGDIFLAVISAVSAALFVGLGRDWWF